MSEAAPFAIAPQTLAAVREELAAAEARLRARYEAHPNAVPLLNGRTRQVDRLLVCLWQCAQMPATAALAAVGGYGRCELYPASDVDLLILLPEEAACDDGQEARIAAFTNALWDVGLKIGHSVRTPHQAQEAASEDLTIQTAFLEARLLCGNEALFEAFCALQTQARDAAAFYEAKLLERQQRYTRYQNTPYALEPNCKEGPGGLRDLHLLGWFAHAAGLGTHWRDLARRRLLTAEETADLRSVERFLRHVRIRLHYFARRAEDRLLFDYQERLAQSFGIEATDSRRASEVFMQHYYQAVRKLTQLNTILLQNYRSMLFAERPVSFYISEHFQSQRELLDIRDEDVFARHPEAMLDAFLTLQEHPELSGMSARTLRALWRERGRIDDDFRARPENRARFLRLFQSRRAILRTFRQLNQYDLLGQYLPAWRNIVGQMQYDLFHVYTVDQHILMTVRNLRRFTMGEHMHEYPEMTHRMLTFERHWLLYVAALFHDIAKGRGGDHSELGTEDARVFCEDHGLLPEDTELIVWLVRHHLLLSLVAQKQDISDPDVITRFAERVGTERRLTALYLLTHADVRATSPKVWNAWREQLFESLYLTTLRTLRGTNVTQALKLDGRLDEARRILARHGIRAGQEMPLWERLDSLYFMRHDADEIAWHTFTLHQHSFSPPIVKAREAAPAGNLQVMVYTDDLPGLFLRITGCFGALGLSILDAKVHTSARDWALDSFLLADPRERPIAELIDSVENALLASLRAAHPHMPQAGRISRQAKHFPIPPQISIRPDESGQRFILHLTATDRPGLLFTIAQVLAEHDIELEMARITTLGERAEDTFVIKSEALTLPDRLLEVERALLASLATSAN